jgi:hypothetical protein
VTLLGALGLRACRAVPSNAWLRHAAARVVDDPNALIKEA